jgi:hypothetical protein
MQAPEGWCMIGSSEKGGDGRIDDLGGTVMRAGIGWNDDLVVLEC